MTLAFCLNQSIKVTILLLVQYINGSLVHYKGVKVNYTRKVNHFLLFFLPLYLDKMFKFEEWLTAMVTVPILMTLTEAVSPHTWDTPFLFSVGYALIFIIKWLPVLG